jgi:hypothetical protein
MPFENSIKNAQDKTIFTGSTSFGLRFGAAADYRISGGISLIGKAHANIGLVNSINQDGEFTSDVSTIKNNDYPLLNISAGIRFNF